MNDNDELNDNESYIKELKEQLNIAAGLLFRLEKYGYINTYDDESQSQVDHFRGIGMQVVKDARRLLDMEPDKSSIKPDKSIDGSLIWKLKKTIDHEC